MEQCPRKRDDQWERPVPLPWFAALSDAVRMLLAMTNDGPERMQCLYERPEHPRMRKRAARRRG